MNIAAMKVLFITVVVWSCYLVAAQEKACSSVQFVCSTVGLLQSTPGSSCKEIYHFNKARVSKAGHGKYWINTTTGVQEVYCDMDLECGGHKGGWMRIADLDMSRGDDCPSGWRKITSPIPACRPPNNNSGCYSTNFSTLGIPYSKVCGMAVGYRRGNSYGFDAARSINGPYVDGISITSGNPKKHIWTYATEVKYDYGHAHNPRSVLPDRSPPSFVHENYYCDSGFTSGLLWSGKFCYKDDNCCSDLGMPWFYRQIPLTISDDIETRICYKNSRFDGKNLVIRELQLYVQ